MEEMKYKYVKQVEPLDETDSPWKFNMGAEVYYSDPKREVSGVYTIIERTTGSEPSFNIYMLSNGRYNIEVHEKDLSPQG